MKEFIRYVCDYCGKPFSSKNACSKHEEKRRAVVDLTQYEFIVDEDEGIETNFYRVPARRAHDDPDTCYFLGESKDDINYHDRFVATEAVSLSIVTNKPLCVIACCYRTKDAPAPWNELKADALEFALEIKQGADKIIRKLE